jgi:formate hydrogenlyase subunit 5
VTADQATPERPAGAFADAVADRVRGGARFCGVFASARGDGTRLAAVLARGSTLDTEVVTVPGGARQYASLTPRVPAAAWYELEIRDMFGLEPAGHPRPGPLVFPFAAGSERPRPGSGRTLGPAQPDLSPLPAHVGGEGIFTMSYGPVRSGVFEAVEYVIETPGEDIPYLRPRVFYKHRGVEARFGGMSADDGVLLAERCEGVASVAHAIAFCGSVEQISGTQVPVRADLVRVLHAELERVANHLDSTIRHTEAAGQAVAYARFSLHKERVQRLRARLCGNRFGRGVIVPGGVAGPPRIGAAELVSAIDGLEAAIRSDMALLMATPSFVDRLRATGVISPETAQRHAAVGPVGRASGQAEDVRFARPYAGYRRLGPQPPPASGQGRGAGRGHGSGEGDALARQRVRIAEMWGSFHLIRQGTDELDGLAGPGDRWRSPVAQASGEAVGWAEAPQGEVLYLVELCEGRLVRVKPRSASFHNLALFPAAFPRDILTDFAFIEASFGLSIAGVAS